MQAALRTAVQELGRGLSTGIVVWSGCRPGSCVCHSCECPACNCYFGTRDREAVDGWGNAAVGAAFLLGLVVGAGLVIWIARSSPREVVGRPYEPLAAPGDSCSPAVLSLGEEAAAEIREIRRRRHGVRDVPGR